MFLRGGNLNIAILFISKSYFKVPKTKRHYFVIRILNKRKLQQIASNHLYDIDFKDSTKLYKHYTKEPSSFLLNDTTLSSDNPLRFSNNLSQNEY